MRIGRRSRITYRKGRPTIKLYNQTNIPDDILRRVLTTAARWIGTKHKDIAVRAVYGGKYSVTGIYNQFCRVRLGWLLGNKAERWITCDGCINLEVVKETYTFRDVLREAEIIWEIAAHEFGHAKDDQAGLFPNLREEEHGRNRRKAHDKRAIEISVYNQFYDRGAENPNLPVSAQITLPKKAQRAILDLAEWYSLGKAIIRMHNVQFRPAASPKIKEENK